MRIYIVHSSSNTEQYIERIKATEEKLIEYGHHIVNPLPEGVEGEFANDDFFKLYASKINICDVLYVMLGWENSDISQYEIKEGISLRKSLLFEKPIGVTS